jgi:hypothetical protein
MAHIPIRLIFMTMRALRLPHMLGIGPAMASISLGLFLRRFLVGYPARAACLTLLLGLAVVYPRLLFYWPESVITRLPWAGLILLGFEFFDHFLPPRAVRPLLAAILAYWLAGAPTDGAAIIHCLPLMLGFWAGLKLAQYFSRRDPALLGAIAASLALAAALSGTGAAPHWPRAALVVAGSSLVLIGWGGAAETLGRALVLVNGAAIYASSQGAVWPIDLTPLAPVLAWLLVGFLPVPGFLAPAPPPGRRRGLPLAARKRSKAIQRQAAALLKV